MGKKYLYGSRTKNTRDASGVSGILISSPENGYFFRVTDSDGEFVDYELIHDDLPITIDDNSFATLYRDADGDDDVGILDHSPSVLGLEEA